MPGPDQRGIEPELAEMRSGERRLGRRRAALGVGAGLVCAGAGALIFAWGRHMDEIQARSEVQFMLPTYAQFLGGALLLAGAILVLLGVGALVTTYARSL